MTPQTSPARESVFRQVLPVLLVLLFGVLAILLGRLLVKPPSQHDPARYGTVVVTFRGWSPAEVQALLPELERLEALGPAFVLDTAGGSRTTGEAIVVRRGTGDCAGGAGFHDVGSRSVTLKPHCVSARELQSILGHELGHALGMGHVCRSAGESARFECSPVGFERRALMNPTVYTDRNMGAGSALTPSDPVLTPGEKDLAEFRRAHP